MIRDQSMDLLKHFHEQNFSLYSHSSTNQSVTKANRILIDQFHRMAFFLSFYQLLAIVKQKEIWFGVEEKKNAVYLKLKATFYPMVYNIKTSCQPSFPKPLGWTVKHVNLCGQRIELNISGTFKGLFENGYEISKIKVF